MKKVFLFIMLFSVCAIAGQSWTDTSNVRKWIKADTAKVTAKSLVAKDSIIDSALIAGGTVKATTAGKLVIGIPDSAIASHRSYTANTSRAADYADSTPYVNNYNEGMITRPVITDAAGSAISITAAGVWMRSDSGWVTSKLRYYLVPQNTALALTDNAISYVVVRYSGGTPVYASFDNRDSINNSDHIPVARVQMSGGNIKYQLTYGEIGKSAAIRGFDRVMRTQGTGGVTRESGFTITETATRVVNITAGTSWFGLSRNTIAAIAQGGLGAVSEVYFHTGGVWGDSTVLTYDNNHYDNGTAKKVLTANRYAVNWIFRNITTNEIDIVLGTGDYTAAQATASMIPALPPGVLNFYVLCGRIIVKKGDATAYAIENVADVSFRQSSITNHADLSNLVWSASGHYGKVDSTTIADSAMDAGKLGGYPMAYHDTVGHGALWRGAVADSAMDAGKLGGYPMAYHDTVGHGALGGGAVAYDSAGVIKNFGTVNYIPKFSLAGGLANSGIQTDAGNTIVGINGAPVAGVALNIAGAYFQVKDSILGPMGFYLTNHANSTSAQIVAAMQGVGSDRGYFGLTSTSFTTSGIRQASSFYITADNNINGLNIGTGTSAPFKIYTNNSERLRVASGGAIGINTTVATAALQINTGTTYDSNSCLKIYGNYPAIVLNCNEAAAGQRAWAINNYWADVGGLAFSVSNARGGDPENAGTIKAVYTSAGKFIFGGTITYPATAAATMEIRGSAQCSTLTVLGSNTLNIDPSYAGLGEIPAGTLINTEKKGVTILAPTNFDGYGVALAYQGSDNAYYSALEYVNPAAGTYTNLLLLKSGGNVGIGTTTPGAKVTIKAATAGTLALVDSGSAQITGNLLINGTQGIGVAAHATDKLSMKLTRGPTVNFRSTDTCGSGIKSNGKTTGRLVTAFLCRRAIVVYDGTDTMWIPLIDDFTS